MADGFLGRWSKRKLDVQEGKPVEPEPTAAPVQAELQAMPAPAVAPLAEAAPLASAPPEPPALTLDDVKALTPESDFGRFVAPDVTPDVKNAAMKKLFSDPRYNVMDGLDTYIDDYSKPDPIPNEMLRKLVSAKFLGLFDEEEKAEAQAAAKAAAQAPATAARQSRDVADNPIGQSVAQSQSPPPAVPAPPDHADPDLRLQQDDADPGKNPGRGAE